MFRVKAKSLEKHVNNGSSCTGDALLTLTASQAGWNKENRTKAPSGRLYIRRSVYEGNQKCSTSPKRRRKFSIGASITSNPSLRETYMVPQDLINTETMGNDEGPWLTWCTSFLYAAGTSKDVNTTKVFVSGFGMCHCLLFGLVKTSRLYHLIELFTLYWTNATGIPAGSKRTLTQHLPICPKILVSSSANSHARGPRLRLLLLALNRQYRAGISILSHEYTGCR